MTLGKFMIETALGNEKERHLTEAEAMDALKEIAEQVAPKIDQIRAENRRAFEETKNIVLA